MGDGEKIPFFPDEHLGRRNTANKMGIPREQMIVRDPCTPRGVQLGGGDSARKLILWKAPAACIRCFSRPTSITVRKSIPR